MVITKGKERVSKADTYLMYKAIHAEANALMNCSREQTMGADLYLTGINPLDADQLEWCLL